jgi:beta-lactamase class A
MIRSFRWLRICFVLTLLVVGGIWAYTTYGPAITAKASLSKATVANVDEASLSTAINSILKANSDLDTSISITDLQTNKTYHWGDSAAYTAASISKLITATAYLHQVDSGQASLDDYIDGETSRALLTKLIENSDNDAWTTLNDTLGRSTLQNYASSIGLTSYSAEDNVMTGTDITLLLSKLYQQKLLSPDNGKLLLGWMQKANMRDYIVAAIPNGTTVYHKVGYLDDRLNETAIISKNGRAYVLTIFSKATDTYDFDRGSRLFAKITAASLSAFMP